MKKSEQIKSLEQSKSADFNSEEYKEFVVKRILASFIDPYYKNEKIVPPPEDDGTMPNLPELPKSEMWYEGLDLVNLS